MTRKEAIAALKARCHYCDHFPTCVHDRPECFQAVEMAIERLGFRDADPELTASIKNIQLYYQIAKNNDWIKHKIAWSLYQAWKDEDKKAKAKEDKTNG